MSKLDALYELNKEETKKSIYSLLDEELDYKGWLKKPVLTEDIAAVKKLYPNISDKDFYDLIALDPTYKKDRDSVGTYGKWILNLFNKNRLDNLGHVKDLLSRFDSNKKYLKNKDINKFKSLDDVDNYLNDENNYIQKSHSQEVRDRQKDRKNVDLNKDAEKVLDADGYEVWIPHTYAASCKLGQGSKWCTASTENDYYYNSYKEQYGGEYYILINKANPEEKYQFHFESGQFMDKDDYQISLQDFLSDKPKLKEYFDRIQIEVINKKYNLNIKDLDEEVHYQLGQTESKYFIETACNNDSGWDSLSPDYAIAYTLDIDNAGIDAARDSFYGDSSWFLSTDDLIRNYTDIDNEHLKKVFKELGIEYANENELIENIQESKYEDEINIAFSDAYADSAADEYYNNASEGLRGQVEEYGFDFEQVDNGGYTLVIKGITLRELFSYPNDYYNSYSDNPFEEYTYQRFYNDVKFRTPYYDYNYTPSNENFTNCLIDKISEV